MEAEDVLGALVELGGVEIQSVFGIVGCIMATRIALQVLRRFGLKGMALSVRALVSGTTPGGVSVALGYPTPPQAGFWPGHLVAICEDRWMIDLSIQQVNLPNFDVDAKPFSAPVSRPFLNGQQSFSCAVGEGHAVYESLPTDETYKKHRDWKTTPGPRQQQLVRQLVRGIQRQLALQSKLPLGSRCRSA